MMSKKAVHLYGNWEPSHQTQSPASPSPPRVLPVGQRLSCELSMRSSMMWGGEPDSHSALWITTWGTPQNTTD